MSTEERAGPRAKGPHVRRPALWARVPLAAALALALLALPVAGATARAGTPAAPKLPGLSVVAVAPAPGRVYRSPPAFTLTFNQAVEPSSVGWATALEAATGRLRFLRRPQATPGPSARAVRISCGSLQPGAYSLVVGPGLRTPSGLLLAKPYVVDFVYAPEPALWQAESLGSTRYDLWLSGPAPLGARAARSFLVTGPRTRTVQLSTSGSGPSLVTTVYATDGQGSQLVTTPATVRELVLRAELSAWARTTGPPTVDSLVTPAALRWAVSNGPGSPLAAFLLAAAHASGDTVALPAPTAVDQTVLSSALTDGGAPGQWQGELGTLSTGLGHVVSAYATSADAASLMSEFLAETGDEVPGASVVAVAAKVLGGLRTLELDSNGQAQALVQAEWAADAVARSKAAYLALRSTLGRSGTALGDAITQAASFDPATVQSRLAAAFAHSALVTAVAGISQALAQQLAAAADPMAAAVLLGVHLGTFLAGFTQWDVLVPGFYRAADIAKALTALAASASDLEARVRASGGSGWPAVAAEVLARRLELAAASDFYTTASDIAHDNYWAEAVDQDIANIVQSGSAEEAAQAMASWAAAAPSDRQLAGYFLPGLDALDPSTLLDATTAFPVWPAAEVAVGFCGMVISEPGVYVLSQDLTTPPVAVPSSPAAPGCLGTDGVTVTSPGVTLDLGGHSIDPGTGAQPDDHVGIRVEAGATGALVEDGSVSSLGGGLPYWQRAVAVAATGTVVTNLLVSYYGGVGVALQAASGSLVSAVLFSGLPGYQTPDYALLAEASSHLQLQDLRVTDGWAGTLVDLALIGVSDSLLEASRVVGVGSGPSGLTDGIYLGCRPPLSSSAAPCVPSVDDAVEGNTVVLEAPDIQASGLVYPAIALGPGTERARVVGNTVDGRGVGYALFDASPCGTNLWADDALHARSWTTGAHVGGNRRCVV